MPFAQLQWQAAAVGAVAAIAVSGLITLLSETLRDSSRQAKATSLLNLFIFPFSIFRIFRTPERSPERGLGAFWDLVGNTPLVKISSLSAELGIEVFGKAEFLNPGGSAKYRVARQIIQDAEIKKKLVSTGDRIFEGTSGSTGISLVLAANCRGYGCSIYMPNEQAKEKADALRALGAHVNLLRPCSITDKEHYVNAAKLSAEALERESDGQTRGYFADQFENLANFTTHYEGTGEILAQTGGNVYVFVASSGTGGTIAGVAARLLELASL